VDCFCEGLDDIQEENRRYVVALVYTSGVINFGVIVAKFNFNFAVGGGNTFYSKILHSRL